MTAAASSPSGSSSSGAKADGPAEPLPCNLLRWRCRVDELPFQTTDEVDPIPGVVGQETAMEALEFGLETNAPGQNIFVRGLTGTGRMTLLRRLMKEIRLSCPLTQDRCYVHNFEQPDRPRLISLPPGCGPVFRRRVDKLADFILSDLGEALSSEGIRERRAAIERASQQRAQMTITPHEEALREAGLALVSVQVGSALHTTLYPLVDGKPAPPEEFEELRAAGKITDEQAEEFHQKSMDHQQDVERITELVRQIRNDHEEAMARLMEEQTRKILADQVRAIEVEFNDDGVTAFLADLVDDVVEIGAEQLAEDEDGSLARRYRVNVVLEHKNDEGCPIILEHAPTLTNLLGVIDRDVSSREMGRSDHLMIRAGALLRADGGYLILEARDVLSEPGAWKVLVRTLRCSALEIVPSELNFPFWGGSMLKPEPIPINVKVILLGDAEMYYLLDAVDPDFPHMFKVLADFDSVVQRDESGLGQYAGVLARVIKDEGLPRFDRSAVAMLVEHGARIAARRGKLTTRFGRLLDLGREAAFLAQKADRKSVTEEDVTQAIKRNKRRADLPSRRFREFMADGTIQVQTSGTTVGQINGLAVLQTGQLTYGFPNRITATIGPGTAGVINIEREAALSGAIHTKGFYILGGLLRHLLQTDHPLAFSASVAFEQSYGGIDGDSASGAEICCLLSALTNTPLRQDIAMTGAIDQFGHILAVGAVNEKIEGFFDVCRDVGLTGTQGVILPRSNVGDLMLRPDVVEACEAGQFAVYAVDTVQQALATLTGSEVGAIGPDGSYPPDTLLGQAVAKARLYWEQAAATAHLPAPTAAEQTAPIDEVEE